MSGFELESMVGTFVGSMEFRWAAGPESPIVIGNNIQELGVGFDDMLAPMVATRQIAIDDMKQRFDTETDLEGMPWEKWSPNYRQGGSQILRKTDDLYDSATSPTTFEVVGNDLFIQTGGLPEYWRIHNQGGEAGKGANIPKRSFLGISEEAGFAVIDIFDDWVARKIDIIIGPATGTAMARGTGGRISGRVGLGRERAPIPPVGFGNLSPDEFGLTNV